MINERTFYVWAGTQAGKARKAGDEAAAQSHSEHARRAMALESDKDRAEARTLFDAAYRAARGIKPARWV